MQAGDAMMKLAGFTVGDAMVFVYAEVDTNQFLNNIEAWLGQQDATPIEDDSAALLMADIEQWLDEQDTAAFEADMATQRDMNEQVCLGWMT